MDYQNYIDPKMLELTNEFQANEMSFDLDEFRNQYSSAEISDPAANFEWTPLQNEESFDMSWEDHNLTAAQPHLSQTSSGSSNFFISFEEFERTYYPSASQTPETFPNSSFSPSSSSTSSPPTSASDSQSPSSSSSSSSSISPFTCEFCPRTFSKRHQLNRHQNLHIKPIACPDPSCTHRTAKQRDMDRHFAVHHAVVHDVFVCPVSGCKYGRVERGFKRKDHLKRHLGRKHVGYTSP